MTKKDKDKTAEELRKALALEIHPASKLKKTVSYPDRFNFFMKYAIKKNPPFHVMLLPVTFDRKDESLYLARLHILLR